MATFRGHAEVKQTASPHDAGAAGRKYIVTKAFQFYADGMLGSYPVGLVVDRPYLVDKFLAAKLPIVPMDSSVEVLECPHCNKKFVR